MVEQPEVVSPERGTPSSHRAANEWARDVPEVPAQTQPLRIVEHRSRAGGGREPLDEAGLKMLEGGRHHVAPELQMSMFVGKELHARVPLQRMLVLQPRRLATAQQ